MNTKLLDSLIQIINSLSDEEKKIISQNITTSFPVQQNNSINLENEPFVEMWKDRKDMEDSNQWLRQLRQNEWQ
ncbi:MAG: hypothetical protein HEQ24_16855 [Dolichospermum sp. BR01]|nr:hypothetical protein [Dolichospermum sp. BR01]